MGANELPLSIELLEATDAANDSSNVIQGNFEVADAPVPATIRSTALTTLTAVEQGIAALVDAYGGKTFEVKTTKGLEAAKAARMAIREPRYNIPHLIKAKKAELKEAGAALEAEGERITNLLLAIEQPIDDQITAEELRKKKERDAKAAAKQALIDSAREVIDAIVNRVSLAVGQPPAGILEMISVLDAIECGEALFGDSNGDVMRAKSETLIKLREQHTRAVAWEEQQEQMRETARLAAIQADIDKFAAVVLGAIGKGSADIGAAMAQVEAIEITVERFAERADVALDARTKAVLSLDTMRTAALTAEANANTAASIAAAEAAAKAKADALEKQRVAQEAQQADLTRQQEAQAAEALTIQNNRALQITAAIMAIEELPDSYTPGMTVATLASAIEKLRAQTLGVAQFGSKVGAARTAHATALLRMESMLANAEQRDRNAAAVFVPAVTAVRVTQEPAAVSSVRTFTAPQAVTSASDEATAAALIQAAAPDLYAALRDILAIVQCSDGVIGFNTDGTVAEWDDFEEITRAANAIEKAGGLYNTAPF